VPHFSHDFPSSRTLLLSLSLPFLQTLIKGTPKGKAIPITGRGGPWVCETSRLPHFLDNQLTDGVEVVSFTRRPLFTHQEDSWYSFPLEAESIPGPQCGRKD
jgi:hypothetical protein